MNAFAIVACGFAVGTLVGATGVGGGSILAPILVLVFRMNPLLAVGTDLLYSAPTKIVGALVHAWQGTLFRKPLVHLCAGGLVGVGCSTAVLLTLGKEWSPAQLSRITQESIGGALIASSLLLLFEHRLRAAERPVREPSAPVLWITGGAVAAIVAFTAVGAGALAMPLLCVLYRNRRLGNLVGTDIAFAAVISSAAAAVRLGTASVNVPFSLLLLCGSIPGVILGSRFAAVGERWLRPVLVTALFGVGVRMI